jgi:hypothetical protein
VKDDLPYMHIFSACPSQRILGVKYHERPVESRFLTSDRRFRALDSLMLNLAIARLMNSASARPMLLSFSIKHS